MADTQSKGASRCPTRKKHDGISPHDETLAPASSTLVPSAIPTMEYSKVGRGGAGNFYSQQDVQAVSKRVMEVKQRAGRVDIR